MPADSSRDASVGDEVRSVRVPFSFRSTGSRPSLMAQ